MKQFDTVEMALDELKKGHLILVTDDEDRENEGDLICAASFATTENVNFMATHAKGLICMPMSAEICRKLQFPQMVMDNTDNTCCQHRQKRMMRPPDFPENQRHKAQKCNCDLIHKIDLPVHPVD